MINEFLEGMLLLGFIIGPAMLLVAYFTYDQKKLAEERQKHKKKS